jgi:2-isopropylmalate synthase
MRSDDQPESKEKLSELLYDWHPAARLNNAAPAGMALHDETLRDGLQSPSVPPPSIEAKLRLLDRMRELSIASVDIGYPAVSNGIRDDCIRLARHSVNTKWKVDLWCAGRATATDIAAIAHTAQSSGTSVGAALFLFGSRLRQRIARKDMNELVSIAQSAVTSATAENLPVMFVIEDASRTWPEDLATLFTAAVEAGARRLCIADTVGTATPEAAAALLSHVRALPAVSSAGIPIDWHGHRDRGLALTASLAALIAGADRVHATAMGIGERCGNAELELIAVNLEILGRASLDSLCLRAYVEQASDMLGMEIPINYPVFGRDAFRTTAGVHAHAVARAREMGGREWADAAYSAIDAGRFGYDQTIELSAHSGHAAVTEWLAARGFRRDDEALVSSVLEMLKSSPRAPSQIEIDRHVRNFATETSEQH